MMKETQKNFLLQVLLIVLNLMYIQCIEFRDAPFQHDLEDYNNAFLTNSIDLEFKRTWLKEKAKGEDRPFIVDPDQEVRKDHNYLFISTHSLTNLGAWLQQHQ